MSKCPILEEIFKFIYFFLCVKRLKAKGDAKIIVGMEEIPLCSFLLIFFFFLLGGWGGGEGLLRQSFCKIYMPNLIDKIWNE